MPSLERVEAPIVPILPPKRGLARIPGATRSQELKYDLAADKITERKSGPVTIYQPYLGYQIANSAEQGVTVNTISSRYTRVALGKNNDREAWFEIIGPRDTSGLSTVEFLTQHQLHLILGDINSPDTAKLQAYAQNPEPSKALIRLASTDEIPYPTNVERTESPEEIIEAARQLSQVLLSNQTSQEIDASLPSLSDVKNSVDSNTRFEPLVTSENGIMIGQPEIIHATLDNSHSRMLLVYPTKSPDGKSAYLITNKAFPIDDVGQTSDEVIGRVDFLCGCQKFGEKAQGTHACAHELLGSLKGVVTPEAAGKLTNDPTIVVAWGGIDANGNGSVMHSIKEENLRSLGIYPTDTNETTIITELQDVPNTEHRNFRDLSAVLWAGVRQHGAQILRLQNGNEDKTNAMMREALNMKLGGYDIDVRPEPHGNMVVPEAIRQQEDAGHRIHVRRTHATN